MDFDFLTVDDVLQIHENQIALYGGAVGLRDAGLLASAVETARVTFDGQLLHSDAVEIAAAYLYHIVQNHPFIDGNKRAGAAAALTSLNLNGLQLDAPDEEFYNVVISVAQGQMSKRDVTAFLRKSVRKAE